MTSASSKAAMVAAILGAALGFLLFYQAALIVGTDILDVSGRPRQAIPPVWVWLVGGTLFGLLGDYYRRIAQRR